MLLAGLGVIAGGWYAHLTWLVLSGAGLSLAAMALMFTGSVARGNGVFEALVELFDTALGLGSNVASFTRLAAFGLTHAAIGLIVWDGTSALWHRGGLGIAWRPSCSSPSATCSPSCSKASSSPSRPCAWSTTSCSPRSSSFRDGRSAVAPADGAPGATFPYSIEGGNHDPPG